MPENDKPMTLRAALAFEELKAAAESEELIPEHKTVVQEAVKILSEVFPLPGC